MGSGGRANQVADQVVAGSSWPPPRMTSVGTSTKSSPRQPGRMTLRTGSAVDDRTRPPKASQEQHLLGSDVTIARSARSTGCRSTIDQWDAGLLPDFADGDLDIDHWRRHSQVGVRAWHQWPAETAAGSRRVSARQVDVSLIRCGDGWGAWCAKPLPPTLHPRGGTDGQQSHRPRHGGRPRYGEHPRLRPREGRPGRRAVRRRDERADPRDPRGRPRGQADDRPHPRRHHRHPAAQGRRDRRPRRDRGDAAALHPAGAQAALLRQAPDDHLRAERRDRGRAARGQGGRLPGWRPPRLHHRGADGRRDRRRAPGPRGHRQHGRRHRRRHHRGGRDLPRRAGHDAVGAHRRRRARPGDRRPG